MSFKSSKTMFEDWLTTRTKTAKPTLIAGFAVLHGIVFSTPTCTTLLFQVS